MQAFFVGLLCICLSAQVAQAQPLPQLYDVSGVAAGDVLNIRAAPSADAVIVGALAPDARGIEVVAQDPAGRWGQVNSGDGAGWVALRFMAARGVVIDADNLPVGLRCFGTEPFWSPDNIGGALRFSGPDMARELPLWIAQDGGPAGDLRRMIRFAGLNGPGVAFLYPAACSDGMSDRAYGLAISAMMGQDSPLFSGCCSLTRPAP